ncbi:hypothetical protein E2C01_036025 [Portunus trituberculatus]|uniref:Uncharacterized protein n=1 Tax=Portunus trituberculatus TaxID=210409 RepID=A0A5B7FD25_PORTR|nr:hypothetical protein [Portunus trituberculatus]
MPQLPYKYHSLSARLGGVVVEEGELVGEALVSVRVQVCVVVHKDVIGGGGDGALGNPLTHQEKVVPVEDRVVVLGDNVVTHSAWRGVDRAASGGTLSKQARVDPLAHHHKAEARVEIERSEALLWDEMGGKELLKLDKSERQLRGWHKTQNTFGSRFLTLSGICTDQASPPSLQLIWIATRVTMASRRPLCCRLLASTI